MDIYHEEIFGPIATIFRFDSEAEVIEAADNCDVGLASYLFTQDIALAGLMFEMLQSGMVAINTGAVSDAAVPYVDILLYHLVR